MKLAIALLSATAAIAISTHAFAADETAKVNSNVQYKDNGGYSSNASASQTDANGTQKSATQSTDVDVDSDGKTTKHVKKVQTTDPKGLGNEKKEVTDVKTQDKNNGGYKKTVETKSIDHAGTDVTAKSTTDVDVDNKGNVTKTTETKKTVDPKTGLFSSKTTDVKTKTVNGQVVDQSTTAPTPSN